MIYVPGNHDEFAREYFDYAFGEIQIRRHAYHRTADGKTMLVIHGDECDGVMIYAKWLAILGDHAYSAALMLNNWFNAIRRRFGLPYWSLSAYLKHRVKNAASFISNFEGAVTREARARGVDGVICGHIHHPEIKDIAGVLYCNDGDWVESCTALTENACGRLEILRWTNPAAEQLSIAPVTRLSVPKQTRRRPVLVPA